MPKILGETKEVIVRVDGEIYAIEKSSNASGEKVTIEHNGAILDYVPEKLKCLIPQLQF